VASLEGGGGNLVIFHYLSASEIWPDKRDDLSWEWSDKRGDLWWKWPYKRENYCNSIITHMYIYLLVSILGFIFYSLGLGLIGGGFFDTER